MGSTEPRAAQGAEYSHVMTAAPRSFTFLLASTRADGNSELLARRAARSLPDGAEARWLRLVDHPLPPFSDTRHSTGYGPLAPSAQVLREATMAATDLVIVTPVYWYGLAWTAKHYLDHWSGWMRDASVAFKPAMKGRRLWAVIVDSDTDGEGSAYPLIETLRRTADYMDMTWGGVLTGHANKPGEIAQSAAALAAAERFFEGERTLEDDALWAAFHERALSTAEWTHTAHLRMAWLHLERYPIDEAHLRMRVGIVRLNAAHGLVETPQRGYHETLTRVWLALVQEARRAEAADPARASAADSASFVTAHGFSRELPLAYYSRERLFSPAARAMFVEPDLAPLPQ
jgi:multimeric flavodoxin WrbA